MSNIIEIPFKMITLNEWIAAERGNKFAAAKIKANEMLKVWTCAKNSKFEIDKNGLFDVELTIHTADNKRDHDNLLFCLKPIFDALVKFGYLANDGRKNIRHITSKIYTTGEDSYKVEFLQV